jgi:solute carrier family 25 aspartate/glutamate transporter 12/13
MATVTEKVKDTLLGVESAPGVSEQNRSDFMKYAIKDEVSGEYYMTEHEFIEAIAPEGEDYVLIQTIRSVG